VESKNGGFLSNGKLAGKVETPKAKGFAVRTPTAIVTDLGTEFGVEVDGSGNTTSHVYRGSVRLQMTARDGGVTGTAEVLHENESACVENYGDQNAGRRIRKTLDRSEQTTGFVREIRTQAVKALDLVDVVAGGNGYSGRRNRGIIPTSGRPSDAPPRSENFTVRGDGKYHRVEGLPFVDGVFIPDGSQGPVQVDSAGHGVDLFGKTKNKTAGYVWAGGVIPVEQGEHPIPTTFGGVDYASSGHGMLFMHANKGITFDLEAIRQANPGWKPLRFRAVAGNLVACDANCGLASLWVIVDGEVRFRRHGVNGCSGGFSVVFPIRENDHFLTLVTTDNECATGISGAWTMFGDPQLELAPVRATPGTTPPESH
jgi:hypothetical protein